MDAAGLSDAELIDQVTTWGARVARGEALHLELIGELDARRAWAQHGVRSCAHWLSWQLGWSRPTARERVRVAGALRELPRLQEAFGQGRVSYSQVRAITRVATPADEHTWLELARHCTGAQLDAAARGADRARAADLSPQERRNGREPVRLTWDEHGDLILTVRIPAHQAMPVLAVLEQQQAREQTARDQQLQQLLTTATAAAGPKAAPGASAEAAPPAGIDLSSIPEAAWADPLEPFPYTEPAYPVHLAPFGERPTPAARQAISRWEQARDQARAIRDAWNDRRERLQHQASAQRSQLSRATLADGLVRAVLHPTDSPTVTVQLLTDPVSGWARTSHDEFLPPATMTELARTLPVQRARQQASPDPHQYDQGRTSRTVTPALRRLIGQLDGERCRFPSCTHTRYLHAHHIQHWSHGDTTDLHNLVLLCSHHHQHLHQTGYTLTLDPSRHLTVHTPDGTALPHHPDQPTASAEALPHATANTLTPHLQGDPFDLGYVVNVMLQHAA